ncbi:helix-turn-helix domain-containing protein [Novosphingobium profundi]|uniref:helix-turn-helix domain-containing protein n=1 Tax=Novosphingobium profundi TaxID=1774954 RepID=UPI001CFDEA68|nr:helix-turn-helix transcriptional regulator [Novosphingobium profundi]
MKFGDYLKQKRAERGWTQPEAASQVKIEQSYLSKLENGKSIPSGDIYQRLAQVYGINPTDMVGVLFPAELDRLRDIDTLRDLLLERSRRDVETPRRLLIAGLAALVLGGGFVGFSMTEPARSMLEYTYRSQGVIAADAPPDSEIPPGAPGADEQTRFFTQMRGPMFTEKVPDGKRIWLLVGSNEIHQPPRYRWALIPGFALIVGGLGCFFVAWRWR